jgi:hypothetical protein
MSTTAKTVIVCPHCSNQLQLDSRLTFASGPKSSAPNGGSGDVGELLASINEDVLESAAAKFVRETRERLEQYGDRIRMSDKQMDWLRKIATGANRKDEW